jgi:hypothetical protein
MYEMNGERTEDFGVVMVRINPGRN